ncbi:MAG: tetratricopeptide repeat protein, partial [Gemmatimonadetes bacterium]|nr:tetratricopeptide repeat protein [Gemmatimonadota bacterium]
MSRIRHLIREIHRRSLWQVLGVFLAMSWGVLNAVDVLTGFAGLPDWTPTMALVLLLIGLPIVMATAVVQEGLPGKSEIDVGAKRDRRAADGAVDAGNSAATTAHESADAQGETSEGVARLLTWRNAIVGGGLAGLLLLVAAGGYLAMWALGIGPVGSLVAQGVLDERDPIILAQFESRSDPSLGEIVTEALSVDLSQSQTVAVLGRDAVRATLGLMGRDPNEPVTSDVAREIAVRDNLKAYVTGDVSRVGTRYLLVSRIVSSETGGDLVSFREEATGDDDLLPAIDRLSTKLREKMGESLKSIRLGTPLEQATTSSLEALRKLTEAERAEERGDYETANRLLEEAVALDPAFAQAHRKISVLRFNVGAPWELIVEAATNAFQHRNRLTERERYLVEANYHNTVTRDTDAVIRAYESVLAISPDEGAALNNLSNIYRQRGQDEEAKPLLEKALAGPGASSVAANNLVFTSLNLGDLEGAERAAQS